MKPEQTASAEEGNEMWLKDPVKPSKWSVLPKWQFQGQEYDLKHKNCIRKENLDGSMEAVDL